MIDALRYEWVRIRTIRSTWWLTGSAFVVGVAISLLLALLFRHSLSTGQDLSADELQGLGAFIVTQLGASGQIPGLVGFLLAITGIFAWGHEYRHGMIRASLTALPVRTTFWAAKFLVVGLWVVLAHLVTIAISALVTSLLLSSYIQVLDGRTMAIIGWQLVSTLLLTWLAMAFTQLTRSQAFGLVTIFLWPLLVESLLNIVFALVPALRDHADLLRFLPFSAQRRMIDAVSDASGVFGDPLSHLGGAIVFGGVTAVLMVAGYLAFTRRDA